MKKRMIAGAAVAGFVFIGMFGGNSTPPSPADLKTIKPVETNVKADPVREVPKPTCDGTNVTTSCVVDGVTYTSYIYHPAVPEQSHTETVTTYVQKATGYCTLCADGTYSPSCATGRGACSHHGGVAEWNAPRYSTVPEYSTRTIVDAPAQEAYYQKIPQ